jgi:hypothetical protein
MLPGNARKATEERNNCVLGTSSGHHSLASGLRMDCAPPSPQVRWCDSELLKGVKPPWAVWYRRSTTSGLATPS